MESSKPIPIFRCLALIAAAGLFVPLASAQSGTAARLASKETQRRAVAIEEAQELLKKGDEAYNAERYAEAVEAYSGARDLIPDAPITAELRDATTLRFAQASVEQARFLSRKGDVAGAKVLLDKVLVADVAPNNPGAMQLRAQLDDPIRTNPALTAQHGKDVDKVRQLLYTAEGAYNLGKFDEATERYKDVLRIDPTNTAARRGMEQAAVAKSDYHKSAYDHARAEMLAQVDKEWELQVPPEVAVVPTNLDPDLSNSEMSVQAKIDRLIIPKIALDQSTLFEAIDFLRASAANVQDGPNINFNINLGSPDSAESIRISALKFDLQLTNVPMSQALKYITEATRTSFSTDDFSVLITPAGSTSAELVSRSYRVPPDFLDSLSSGATETATEDPFAQGTQTTGLLVQRMGAQEALAKQGVAFPEGASAIMLGNSLRVVNTAANQDIISQVIETITKTEPITVSVQVTMIRTGQTNLEELGFDWLLDNFGFGHNSWIPGEKELNLGGGTQGNGDPITDIPLAPNQFFPGHPITSGNRSGDSATTSDKIDELLIDQAGRQSPRERAPGVFGLRGELNSATVQMLMRGLSQKKGVDLMGKPSVISRSGQSSSVTFVREFIYPEEYEPPELPNTVGSLGAGGVSPVTPATPTAFKKRDVGVTMEVLPVVDANKQFVNVTLNPTFVDFDGFVNYGSPINTQSDGLLGPTVVNLTANTILMPVFSKQAVTTSVDVMDGATVVLGGLEKNAVENVEDKTPILGDIPLVGRLFQSKIHKTSRTAVIFLVHVELMDPTGRGYRDR